MEGYSDWEAEVHKKIENYFLSHPACNPFPPSAVFSYAILGKGTARYHQQKYLGTAWRLSGILWKKQASNADWFIAVGEDAAD
ncbi:MAG: hypothetical protein ACLUTA_16335 [Blautia wexlerae]